MTAVNCAASCGSPSMVTQAPTGRPHSHASSGGVNADDERRLRVGGEAEAGAAVVVASAVAAGARDLAEFDDPCGGGVEAA